MAGPLNALPEILAAEWHALWSAPWIPPLGAAFALLLWLGRSRWSGSWLGLGLALPLFALAAALAWSQLSVVDDAFITFRYVKNLSDGQGPVFNPGERVEGITNFGWMLLLWLLHAVLSLRIEYAALLLGLGSYLGLVAVTASIERALQPGAWPFAAVLVALCYPVTAFASTGLETLGAFALVMLGMRVMLHTDSIISVCIAGILYCAAGIVRMDHLIAWGCGFLWLLVHNRSQIRHSPLERWQLACYLLTIVPFIALSLWKFSYYGDWLPNTYYAKSADSWYISQGLVYSTLFWVGTQLWIAAPALLLWPLVSAGRERQFAGVVLLFSALWQLYVLKVGGDFMVHRFLLPLVPLVLIACVRTLHVIADQHPKMALAGIGLLGATVRGHPLIEDRELVRWDIANETAIYRVTSLRPFTIGHHSFEEGKAFRRLLTHHGVKPMIATSGIGMVGYYSEFPLVDLLGLTDARIARQPVRNRGRPGHEKKPPRGYLEERGVLLARQWTPQEWVPLTKITLPSIPSNRWNIYRYDEDRVEALIAAAPELKITRFRPWIERSYLPKLASKTKEQALSDLAFFDWYYWSLNGEDDLREKLVSTIDTLPSEAVSRRPSPR